MSLVPIVPHFLRCDVCLTQRGPYFPEPCPPGCQIPHVDEWEHTRALQQGWGTEPITDPELIRLVGRKRDLCPTCKDKPKVHLPTPHGGPRVAAPPMAQG